MAGCFPVSSWLGVNWGVLSAVIPQTKSRKYRQLKTQRLFAQCRAGTLPVCECERNIERAFDILFEEILKRDGDALDVKPKTGDDGANAT